ncbi:MAG: hypothetical protein NTW18_04875 [Candidatus Omnitrophica bacterium]|nr:hypothetical protein [Candidatus Omnitrophota bacterium]
MNTSSITPQSFILEFLNPPMNHSVDNTQKLFTELKDTYANYTRPADNVTELSHIDRNSQEVKKLVIARDKIIILNEFTSATLDSFWKIASDDIKKAVTILNIPLFFYRQYTIRFTASPLKEKDSRIFLGNRVCALDEAKLKPFGRPILGIGMRFFIPAIQTEQNEYNIRVESLLQDTGRIFLENQARFLVPLQLQGDYVNKVKEEVDKTYKFLRENISAFLEQYNSL